MNTRPDECLPYLDLARQGARVERSVQAQRLQRLVEIAPGQSDVRVEMTFQLDEHGRPWVMGTAHVTVQATCQRCLEQFDTDMQTPFELCIVRNPDLASLLANEVDVLVPEGDAVSVAEVVEDELILGVPEVLCTETPCPYAPPLEYPAGDEDEAAADGPFQVLSVLKRKP